MNDKDSYILLAEQHSLPLQMQPWWLDAVCGADRWQVVLSRNREGQLQGALPYYLKRKLGLSIISMPPFTDYTGPWMRLPEGNVLKRHRIYTIENRILADLIGQLPATAFFNQQYYPGFNNWLPFLWKGYRQTSYYTFHLDLNRSAEDIWAGFKGSVRTNIKKAERSIIVSWSNDAGLLYELLEKSFALQGLSYPYSFETLALLFEALQKRGCGRIYLGREKESGQPAAVLLSAWDENTVYFLLSGGDPAFRTTGAMHLVYWQAIRDLAGQAKTLDFCGSIIESIEHFTRSFGGERRMHFRIFRTGNRWLRLAALLLGRDF